jgi:hypothetical protein
MPLLNGEVFNDHFNIFVGNKNDLFFHGSSALASNVISFPVGRQFSDTLYNARVNNQIDDPEDKNSILTRLGNPDIGFFSNIESAMLYSGGKPTITNSERKCKGKCINAFELNQRVYIMVMNDVYNVYKIIEYIIYNPNFLQSQKVRNILDNVEGDNDKERLNYLFTNFYCTEEDVFDYDYEYDDHDEEYEYLVINRDFLSQIIFPDNDYYYYRGNRLFGRYSVTIWDLPLYRIFSAFFAANPGYNIQGCGNNLIDMGIIGSNRYNGSHDHIDTRITMETFHPEVVFFEQLKVLNRLYTHPIDWQHNISKDNTRYIKPYLNQLEKFKIINFNDYSGDIYDTTLWTLLIYESLSISTNSRCSMISAPVALLSHYLEPYSMCMDSAIINRTQENYLLDMQNVTWNNVFNVISTNLLNELQNHVQLHDSDNLIYMKIVTYVYLSYKDAIIHHIIHNQNFYVPNINDIFSKTFNLMCMYNLNNVKNVLLEYSRKVIIDVFYLALAAYIAKSSTFDFFEFRNENVMNNDDEIVDVRRLQSMNISSRIFPFLSNISSVHRGYPYNQTHIDTLLDNLLQYYIDFEIDQDKAEEVIDQFYDTSTETNKFLNKLDKLDNDKLTGRVDDIVYLSGNFYAPYVTKIVHNIMTLCPDNITIDTRGNKRENIIYILKLLKPFFNIVFEEFSTKRYPTEKGKPTNTLPRINHNGLNHLRSVYFTAYVLETSNFIEYYKIDNNELFLILLSSYFVSIARFDEAKAREPNINFTPDEYYDLNGIVPNPESDYFYQHDFDCTHLRYMSTLILADVFEIIKRKIPGLQTVDNVEKFNIDNALHLAALSCYDIYLSGVGAEDLNKQRIIDFTSIQTVGHYFDHSRPTTGYAQLDTSSSPNNHYNEPRGPDWLYNFIVKFYDAPDWTTRKSFYYSRIYQSLQESGFENRVLRDPILMDQEDSLRADTSTTQNNIFYPYVTYNFDAMSIDFHLAWKNIFASFFDQNYNVPEGAWVTQNGVDNNDRNAP